MLKKTISLILACILLSTAKCSTNRAQTLKEAFKKDFLIGCAVGSAQMEGQDPQGLAIVEEQYNTITLENGLKPGPVHPRPDSFSFDQADLFVEYGKKNNMFLIGHTLVWHAQTAPWMYRDSEGNLVDRETLLTRMKDHIFAVVGRYKGDIGGWDVVNEALQDDGSDRRTRYRQIIGDDYVQKAFEFAREADPGAELYYNDFNLWKPEKREGCIRLIRDLQAKGVKIDGIGMQGHWGLDYPPIEEAEESFVAFSELGVQVMITELDINILPDPGSWRGADLSLNVDAQKAVNPYVDGLPDSMQQVLADRYAEFFALFKKHSDKISRITFWGVHDGHSWLNYWPVRGRSNYPLLFGRDYLPKKAYYAVLETAR